MTTESQARKDRNLTPEEAAQEQLEAYNNRDLQRFAAVFAEDVLIYRAPFVEPTLSGRAAMAAHYAANRFNRPDLHAELLSRMVVGNKVVDHERIRGVRDEPFEMVAVYQIAQGLIRKVWFFDAE